MLTINDLGKRKPYTYKEIVEIDYPDYWKAANDSVLRADAIQKMMGKMLPIFHDHLPADTEKWGSEKAKSLLLNYLKLRTLYGFGHYIWEKANRLCHELGKSSNDGDYDGVEKAKTGQNRPEGSVHNGGEAMNLYPQIVRPGRTAVEIEADRKSLLEYCKLDTLAMVKVWEKLMEMAER